MSRCHRGSFACGEDRNPFQPRPKRRASPTWASSSSPCNTLSSLSQCSSDSTERIDTMPPTNYANVNRPFLANFLAAFRAHAAVHKQASSSTSGTTAAVVTAAKNVAASATAISGKNRSLSTLPSNGGGGVPDNAVEADTNASPTTMTTTPTVPSPSSPLPILAKSQSINPTVASGGTSGSWHQAFQPLQRNVSSRAHGRRTPPSPSPPVAASTSTAGSSGGLSSDGAPIWAQYTTAREARERRRRGSDSSSSGSSTGGCGYREVAGAEKWYIGGRAATGEDRYYKLCMVRRQTSADRLSMDRLSL